VAQKRASGPLSVPHLLHAGIAKLYGVSEAKTMGL
jgi:hypothetical protein